VPTVDAVRLLQPPSASDGRAVQSVRITVGDGAPVDVVLGPESREGPGQLVPIPSQAADSVTVEITGVVGGTPDDPHTPVGFAEVEIGSARIDEVVRLPLHLLDRVGEDLDGHSLDVVLSRLRLHLPETDRLDDETRLDRRFELPVARSFGLRGTARLDDAGDREPADVGTVCRDDLVRIDERPLPVRLLPPEAPDDPATVEACEPVDLTAGSHRVTATSASDTGWDIDQLVLSSDADGRPAAVAPRGTPSEAAPPVRTTDESTSSVEAEVDADGTPFWFVQGQSAGEGWVVEAEGASVGPRTRVDGYTNGWVLTPDGSGTVTVRLRWAPQRLVWVGMAVSLAAVVLCVIVLVRRRPAPDPSLRARPGLGWPSRTDPRSFPVVGGATALVVAAALLVATPAVAVAGGVLTVVAGTVPRGRLALLLAAPVALIASRLLTERPSLAWLALAVVAADLLLSRPEPARSRG
jgi:hypothetical protein